MQALHCDSVDPQECGKKIRHRNIGEVGVDLVLNICASFSFGEFCVPESAVCEPCLRTKGNHPSTPQATPRNLTQLTLYRASMLLKILAKGFAMQNCGQARNENDSIHKETANIVSVERKMFQPSKAIRSICPNRVSMQPHR